MLLPLSNGGLDVACFSIAKTARLGACGLLLCLLTSGCGTGGASTSGGNTQEAGASGSGGTAGTAGDAGSDGGGEGGEGGAAGTENEGGVSGAGGSVDIGGESGSGQGQGGSLPPPENTCGNACGPVELCDPDHLGYDDNCNGQVDEGCPCIPGQTHWCFMGDPLKRFEPGCQDGIERCSEVGTFSLCSGGKHATGPGGSCEGTAGPCQDLVATPFGKVTLGKGTTGFSSNADPGSESYSVWCPPNVSNCPAVQNGSSSAKATFQPLQSGQYGVTYTKRVNGIEETCAYGLYVNGGGLRVELSWDNAGKEGTSAKGPDLDLHVHKPGGVGPWGFSGAVAEDCYFGNCRSDNFLSANGNPGDPLPGPSWFNEDPSQPEPRNWTKYADKNLNACYSAPRGTGGQWAAGDKGCHNPRLDLDNFQCDATVTDPNDPSFCAPENINFDEISLGKWTRVAVNYNGLCTSLDTHPVVSIYCGGGQVAQLGSMYENGQLVAAGYDKPVTFTSKDCGNKFWLAADVYVTKSECGELQCVVQPLYQDAGAKTPLFLTPKTAETTIGPPYPPTP